MIKVENLTKKFSDFLAVDDVSFSVNKGEIFAFLGPNGAHFGLPLDFLVLGAITLMVLLLGSYLFSKIEV